jgi:hypothetical protein
MGLPYDVSRCTGDGSAICATCARTEPGRPTHQWFIAPATHAVLPPRTSEVEIACPNRIAQEAAQ